MNFQELLGLGALAGAVALALVVPPTAAADDRDRFVARTYRDPAGGKLLYRLLTPPNYDAAKRYPLVLFLHGAGERGDDNVAQLVHGMADFASDPIRERYPCFVIAPQCPTNEKWVDVDWSALQHDMPLKPAESLRLALAAVEELRREFAIDGQRLYITGLSMGGYGTWDAIQRQPTLFAAAVPICGGGDPKQVARIARLPIWAFHGAKDEAVKPQRSREMIAALKAVGGMPKYTEYPDAAHDSWTATYRDPALYQWLFSQRRAPADASAATAEKGK